MRLDSSNETIKNVMFDIIASLAIRDEEIIKILSTNLVSMYDENGLPYERITDYVYNSDFNENNIQIIDENLQAIKKCISNNIDVVENGFKEKHLNIIPKLDRHYKMAYVQKNFILKNGTEAQKIAEEAKSISKEANMVSEQTKIVSENVEKDKKIRKKS